jgi:predicted O-linked N-acetylglucosamine transferase (SPINDLY family)
MQSEDRTAAIQNATQAGMAHHQAGRLAEAERAYRQVLQIDPHNAVALHLLGIVAHQSGDNVLSLHLIDQAVAVKADFALAFNSRGNVMQVLGRFEEALASYDRAVAIRPDYADAWCHRGHVLKVLGRCEEALASADRALALRPGFPEALSNRGNALRELERPDEALASYDKALAIEPGFAEVMSNRGNALKDLGRYDEALASYDRALAIRPGFVEALSNRGSALNELKRYTEALASLDKALAVRPRYPEALSNRGNALTKLRRHQEALASYDSALAIKPVFPEALSNRGDVLNEMNRIEEAVASWHSALKLKADLCEVHSSWIHGRYQLCDWAGLEEEVGTLRKRVTQLKSGKAQPFHLLALPGVRASEQLLGARQYANETYGELLSRSPLCDTSRPRVDGRKLRIGYLSSDLREHAMSYVLAGIFESHDRGRFEIFGYSCGPDDASPMRRRMRSAFDTFVDVDALSDSAAAGRILDDRIDILVELNGYTAKNRMSIVALRPAPLQVTWLGYPGTLGHPRLADYLIGDPVVTPIEHATHYSETLALMPHCYQPNDRQRRIGQVPTRAAAGLPEQGFVFCSFNQTYKITPLVFDVWCRLLAEVPGSLLWLPEPGSAARVNLRHEAAARGIAAERLVFSPLLPLSDHLARIQLADLALDTYPYTSHVTASDALWAGTPLVTMAGETFASRVAASILRAAGLPYLVAQDPESYFQEALGLAQQPDRLRKIREDLSGRRMSCPLFDTKRFTRNLERLYRIMWVDHCAGRKAHIVLEE